MMEKLSDEEMLKIILSEKFQNRFWLKVDKSAGEEGCWNWIKGPYNKPKKYGQIKLRDNFPMDAHRVSLTMKLGYIPHADTLHSPDKCKGNKKCVNPTHLRDGSESENRNDENIAEKTLRHKKHRIERFKAIVEKASESEKIFFYKYLQNELFPKQ